MNEHESSCFLDVTVRETFETNLNSNHIIVENAASFRGIPFTRKKYVSTTVVLVVGLMREMMTKTHFELERKNNDFVPCQSSIMMNKPHTTERVV